MSLLDDFTEKCIMLDKLTHADGFGGYVSNWVEGAPFEAAIALDSSTEARLAMAQGVKDNYTVTTTKALNLQYHDVFKRISDGKIFRVTSDGDDMKTPRSAGLDMRQVQAEEFFISL